MTDVIAERAGIARAVITALHGKKPGMVVSVDANVGFTPPPKVTYAEVRFVDGAEAQVAFGGTKVPVRTPVLVYVDIRGTLGEGDAEVSELGEVVKDGLRRLSIGTTRFARFEQGPEGKDGTDYRKQVVAVFRRSGRV